MPKNSFEGCSKDFVFAPRKEAKAGDFPPDPLATATEEDISTDPSAGPSAGHEVPAASAPVIPPIDELASAS